MDESLRLAMSNQRIDRMISDSRAEKEEQLPVMETVGENRALSTEEKLARLQSAKGSGWYAGWKPYCLMCSTVNRMEAKDYGFQCNTCKNMIGFNLTRLQESPHNR